MFGYWGKLLLVNLSRKSYEIIELKEEFFKKYLGGVGLATKLIFDMVHARIDSLSPDNVLVFAVGPFQGTIFPGSGKWVIASRSPQTGIWGESCAGGYWGVEFKNTGFDALVITGRSHAPVYLYISDESIEFRNASHLWGKTTTETQRAIKEELRDKKVTVACIGPAGENLVRFACVINEHGVAGRCGMGAVMGSKNLKAIAVRGTKQVEVANPDELRELTLTILKRIRESELMKLFRINGTAGGGLVEAIQSCECGIKNWSQGVFEEGLYNLSENNFKKAFDYFVPIACAQCPIACHKRSKISHPKEYSYEGYGPEYESVAMLGPLCLISDPKAIAYMAHLCDEYGIDTISTGSLIAFTMEACEKGLISKDDLGGSELKWGDADAAIKLINDIVYRRHFGRILADGIKAAIRYIGDEAEEIAVHVKGLEVPAHDPRATFQWSVNYATGTTGANHQRGFSGWINLRCPELGLIDAKRHSMKDVALWSARCQDWACLCNSYIQCEAFLYVLSFTEQVLALNYITGWRLGVPDVAKIGERIFNLQRVLCLRFGISKKDDRLPKRLRTPLREGGAANKVPEPFEEELENYYKIRGWSSDGKPTKKKLIELDLEEAIGELY